VRRSEREIEDRSVIDKIIRQCLVCHLGLSDGEEPYVVPLCFGYDGEALYFHGAAEGKKIDILRRNRRVCFEFDIPKGMREAEQGCSWGMRYQSVIGFGVAEILSDHKTKKKALEIIMAQYSDKEYVFPEDVVKKTTVIKVVITRMTGKQV